MAAAHLGSPNGSPLTSVYVSGAGQRDNIGDSVLRRAFLHALRGVGDLNIYINDLPLSYQSGLHLVGDEALYASGYQWRVDALRSAAVRPTVFSLSAGEIPVHGKALAALVADGGIAALLKLRRRPTIAMGTGFKSPESGLPRSARWSFRRMSVVSWRDDESRVAAGLGTGLPDWAFREGADTASLMSEPGPRTHLSISCRGDLPLPPDEWFDTLARSCSHLGLEPLVVSQVQRDNARTREIATRLGASAVLFEDPDHATQEKVVREIYARSQVVVSDRLHALIIGATEGAAPAAFVPSTPSKVTRVMTSAGYSDLGRWGTDPAANLQVLERRAARRAPELDLLARARTTLQTTVDTLATQLRLERAAAS